MPTNEVETEYAAGKRHGHDAALRELHKEIQERTDQLVNEPAPTAHTNGLIDAYGIVLRKITSMFS